jgi:hypothetical protein
MSGIQYVEKLPAYGCLIDEGYKNTLRKKQDYLGDVREVKFADTIECKYVINNNQDMEDFTQWWLIYLDYGAKAFEIDTLFMGYKGRIVVVMDNDLMVDYIEGAWSIPMKLNVKYILDPNQMT